MSSGSPDITAATFLQRITEKMPEYAGPAEHVDYLALLDRCLLDRHLSVHESQALVSLAEEVGLSRNTCQQLHLEYFNQLADVAWSDGVLTGAEMADLVAVGNLLDIPTEAIAASLEARETKTNAGPTNTSLAVGAFALTPGDLIVLTGEMTRPRSEWEGHLRRRGLTAGSGVTKKVKLVAAADPDSLSGKAKKATGLRHPDRRGRGDPDAAGGGLMSSCALSAARPATRSWASAAGARNCAAPLSPGPTVRHQPAASGRRDLVLGRPR